MARTCAHLRIARTKLQTDIATQSGKASQTAAQRGARRLVGARETVSMARSQQAGARPGGMAAHSRGASVRFSGDPQQRERDFGMGARPADAPESRPANGAPPLASPKTVRFADAPNSDGASDEDERRPQGAPVAVRVRTLAGNAVRVLEGVRVRDAVAASLRVGPPLPADVCAEDVRLVHLERNAQGVVCRTRPLDGDEELRRFASPPGCDEGGDDAPEDADLWLVHAPRRLRIFFNDAARMALGLPVSFLDVYVPPRDAAVRDVEGVVRRLVDRSAGCRASRAFGLHGRFGAGPVRLLPPDASVAALAASEGADTDASAFWQYALREDAADDSHMGVARCSLLDVRLPPRGALGAACRLFGANSSRSRELWVVLQGTTLFCYARRDARPPVLVLPRLHARLCVYRGAVPGPGGTQRYAFEVGPARPGDAAVVFASHSRLRVEKWLRRLREAGPAPELRAPATMACAVNAHRQAFCVDLRGAGENVRPADTLLPRITAEEEEDVPDEARDLRALVGRITAASARLAYVRPERRRETLRRLTACTRALAVGAVAVPHARALPHARSAAASLVHGLQGVLAACDGAAADVCAATGVLAERIDALVAAAEAALAVFVAALRDDATRAEREADGRDAQPGEESSAALGRGAQKRHARDVRALQKALSRHPAAIDVERLEDAGNPRPARSLGMFAALVRWWRRSTRSPRPPGTVCDAPETADAATAEEGVSRSASRRSARSTAEGETEGASRRASQKSAKEDASPEEPLDDADRFAMRKERHWAREMARQQRPADASPGGLAALGDGLRRSLSVAGSIISLGAASLVSSVAGPSEASLSDSEREHAGAEEEDAAEAHITPPLPPPVDVRISAFHEPNGHCAPVYAIAEQHASHDSASPSAAGTACTQDASLEEQIAAQFRPRREHHGASLRRRAHSISGAQGVSVGGHVLLDGKHEHDTDEFAALQSRSGPNAVPGSGFAPAANGVDSTYCRPDPSVSSAHCRPDSHVSSAHCRPDSHVSNSTSADRKAETGAGQAHTRTEAAIDPDDVFKKTARIADTAAPRAQSAPRDVGVDAQGDERSQGYADVCAMRVTVKGAPMSLADTALVLLPKTIVDMLAEDDRLAPFIIHRMAASALPHSVLALLPLHEPAAGPPAPCGVCDRPTRAADLHYGPALAYHRSCLACVQCGRVLSPAAYRKSAAGAVCLAGHCAQPDALCPPSAAETRIFGRGASKERPGDSPSDTSMGSAPTPQAPCASAADEPSRDAAPPAVFANRPLGRKLSLGGDAAPSLSMSALLGSYGVAAEQPALARTRSMHAEAPLKSILKKPPSHL